MPTALRMPINELKACSKQTKRVWYQWPSSVTGTLPTTLLAQR